MDFDGDPSPVVLDLYASIFEKRDFYVFTDARDRLIDTVINHFRDQMVQTGFAGRSDIHSRSFPYGFEPFQDLDILSSVIL
jgi:hypothetical protein